MKSPFFSIIVPVYNIAPYLRECLDSVLAQTFTEWECLCVNDGSTDESGAILNEYATKDSRFRIFHQPNAGVSAARNLALDNVKGEWIAFLDGDDVLGAEWIKQIFEVITHVSVDWVRVHYTRWDGNPAALSERLNEDRMLVHYKGKQDFWRLLGECAQPFCNVIRSQALRNVRFDSSVKLCEDGLFLANVLPNISSCCEVNLSNYFYRIREGSAIHSQFSGEQLVGYLDGWKRLSVAIPFMEEPGVSRWTTWRIQKDVKLHLLRMKEGDYEKNQKAVLSYMNWLRNAGVFHVRELSSLCEKVKWLQWLVSGDYAYLQNGDRLFCLFKCVPYWVTKDVRWMTETRKKIKGVFSTYLFFNKSGD